MEHQGIRIEFIGQIGGCVYILIFFICFSHTELFSDRGNQHDFTSLIRQLSPPGELSGDTTYDFQFITVEKPYESYTGTNVQLR